MSANANDHFNCWLANNALTLERDALRAEVKQVREAHAKIETLLRIYYTTIAGPFDLAGLRFMQVMGDPETAKAIKQSSKEEKVAQARRDVAVAKFYGFPKGKIKRKRSKK